MEHVHHDPVAWSVDLDLYSSQPSACLFTALLWKALKGGQGRVKGLTGGPSDGACAP